MKKILLAVTVVTLAAVGVKAQNGAPASPRPGTTVSQEQEDETTYPNLNKKMLDLKSAAKTTQEKNLVEQLEKAVDQMHEYTTDDNTVEEFEAAYGEAKLKLALLYTMGNSEISKLAAEMTGMVERFADCYYEVIS